MSRPLDSPRVDKQTIITISSNLSTICVLSSGKLKLLALRSEIFRKVRILSVADRGKGFLILRPNLARLNDRPPPTPLSEGLASPLIFTILFLKAKTSFS